MFKRPWLLIAATLIALTCLILAGYWLVGDLPAPTADNLRAVTASTLIFDRNGQLIYESIGKEGKQTPLSFDEMPEACWHATVAVEDSRFFLHPGVDLLAIGRAAWLNWRNGGIVSGASTLTQQLARNTLMTTEERYEQSFRRKLREAWLALRIEQRFSKQDILAYYHNQVYYGNFAHGLEAAAQAYFGKSARELDLAECSLLAGLPQNPPGYNPLHHLEAARLRQSTVLGQMILNDLVSREEAELALAETLHFAPNPFTIQAPHFASYVESQAAGLLGFDRISRGGLRVHTTLDLDWQQQSERIVTRRLDQLAADREAPPDRRVQNAAVVILDPHSGAIRTMIGSPDYFDPTIDGAVNGAVALRQPGSAIKPITYAVALDPQRAADSGEQPLTAASVIADVRTVFSTAEGEPYVPQNYDRTWHGPVGIRTALASSFNLPAVKVLDRIGVDALIRQAQRQGITSFRPGQRYGLALTLGGSEVSLVELSGAYGAFANGGLAVEPYAIDRIEDADGNMLFEIAEPRPPGRTAPLPEKRVLDQRIAYLITDILSDNNARAQAFGRNSILRLTRPAAVKTGTTTDWRDNWTVGYTPDLVTGVWVGNADNTPMHGVSGVSGAGPIWHDIMEMSHHNLPVRDFQQPPGLVRMEVCADSGLLPTEHCSRRHSELFIAGTEPVEFDTVYRPVLLDSCSGGRAGPDTPDNCLEQGTIRVYSPELQEWARAHADNAGLAGNLDDTHQFNVPVPGSGATESDQLVLTSPDPDRRFRLSESLPDELQQVRIAAHPGLETPDQVMFLVDGNPVGKALHVPFEVWWQLSPGPHMISAVAELAGGDQVTAKALWIDVQ
ncbi:MAG: transglycosylase domain-containing protein [Chloroflexota bacterium]|nr:transglycosylase domain-containing protein [Chloroflexota bacterium]